MKTKYLALIVIVLFVVILGGCGCNKYNSLVQQDTQSQTAWANVQSAYQRRADLIPNLVNTVKGEANFEKSTLEGVIQARASATQIKVDPTNLTPEKLQEFQQAQGQLSQALGRLLMVSEQYPTLRANDAFRGLQAQLESTENRINIARNDYNTSVQSYNTAVRTFPGNIIAGFTGFKAKAPFIADAAAQKAPTVTF